jgi:hypothetical protein
VAVPASDPGQPEDGTISARTHDPVDGDPVPGDVRAAARAAYSCRWVEANVASLVFDSLLDGGARRGPRHLVFRGEGLTVEVDVAVDRSAVGRLVPPSETEVVLRWPGGSAPTRSDELGCFILTGVPRGPASLRFPARAEEGPGPVGTEWIVF